MALSYVDFIAKNVEVCVKYYENKEARWYTGKVIKVVDRYLDDDFNECVKCVVKYDDDKYTDIFCEREYNTDDENAWRFGERFVPLVESVKAIVDDFDETEEEDEEEVDTDTVSLVESVEAVVDDCENDTDTPEKTTSSASSDCETEPQLVQAKVNKRRSLMNNVGATLFMLAPWIASVVALFNARKDIFEALKKL
jgi:hypothetical protein